MATRVCPECGSQYVALVRRCIDCDVMLVDQADPDAPESGATVASPVGDGDQIAYELEGWGNQLKVTLEGMLDRAGIRRVWESGALVVPAEHETEVDELVATLEGGDVVVLEDDTPQIAFDIDGVTPAELDDLDARLLAASIAHAWDDEGGLLVAEADEAAVAALIDEVLAGVDDGDDGLAVQQALSELYVAVDKLVKAPTDRKLVDRYLAAEGALEGLGVPYGLTGADWQSLVDEAAELATAVRPPDEADDADDESGDDDPDDADDRDGEALAEADDESGDDESESESDDDDDDGDGDGDGDGDDDDDDDEEDDDDEAEPAEPAGSAEDVRRRADQLRDRLRELV